MAQPAVAPAAAAAVQGQGQFPHHNVSLYVGDLQPECTEVKLFEVMRQAGPVMSIRVCRDSVTGRSLGYAYVNYQNQAAAEQALETLNYHKINDKSIRLMWSHRDPTLRKSANGNVFIKNLDPEIDTQTLFDTFSQFGNILSCKVSVNPQTQASRGYGFVHFEVEESANNAIEKVNGMLMNGKEVYVSNFIHRSQRIAQSQAEFCNCYVKGLKPSITEEEIREQFNFRLMTCTWLPHQCLFGGECRFEHLDETGKDPRKSINVESMTEKECDEFLATNCGIENCGGGKEKLRIIVSSMTDKKCSYYQLGQCIARKHGHKRPASTLPPVSVTPASTLPPVSVTPANPPPNQFEFPDLQEMIRLIRAEHLVYRARFLYPEETTTVEFKQRETFSVGQLEALHTRQGEHREDDNKTILKVLTSFLNGTGYGILVFGVDDGGRVQGMRIPEDEQKNFADKFKLHINNLLTQVAPPKECEHSTIFKQVADTERFVIVISIWKRNNSVYYFKYGKYYYAYERKDGLSQPIRLSKLLPVEQLKTGEYSVAPGWGDVIKNWGSYDCKIILRNGDQMGDAKSFLRNRRKCFAFWSSGLEIYLDDIQFVKKNGTGERGQFEYGETVKSLVDTIEKSSKGTKVDVIVIHKEYKNKEIRPNAPEINPVPQPNTPFYDIQEFDPADLIMWTLLKVYQVKKLYEVTWERLEGKLSIIAYVRTVSVSEAQELAKILEQPLNKRIVVRGSVVSFPVVPYQWLKNFFSSEPAFKTCSPAKVLCEGERTRCSFGSVAERDAFAGLANSFQLQDNSITLTALSTAHTILRRWDPTFQVRSAVWYTNGLKIFHNSPQSVKQGLLNAKFADTDIILQDDHVTLKYSKTQNGSNFVRELEYFKPYIRSVQCVSPETITFKVRAYLSGVVMEALEKEFALDKAPRVRVQPPGLLHAIKYYGRREEEKDTRGGHFGKHKGSPAHVAGPHLPGPPPPSQITPNPSQPATSNEAQHFQNMTEKVEDEESHKEFMMRMARKVNETSVVELKEAFLLFDRVFDTREAESAVPASSSQSSSGKYVIPNLRKQVENRRDQNPHTEIIAKDLKLQSEARKAKLHSGVRHHFNNFAKNQAKKLEQEKNKEGHYGRRDEDRDGRGGHFGKHHQGAHGGDQP